MAKAKAKAKEQVEVMGWTCGIVNTIESLYQKEGGGFTVWLTQDNDTTSNEMWKWVMFIPVELAGDWKQAHRIAVECFKNNLDSPLLEDEAA